MDPTSRELLDLIMERVECWPVLLIATFRPEFQPPWVGQPQVSTMTVNRLDRRDQSVLVKLILGGKTLPDGVVDQIAQRADGVPLFIEELTKSVLESGLLPEERGRFVYNGPLPPLAIPGNVACLTLGPARPISLGASGGTDWCRDWAPISLCAVACGPSPFRGRAGSRAHTACDLRASLPTRRTTGCGLSLQARTGARRSA